MESGRDHAIQNQVRAILFRRFVDVTELTYGCVNGVVYLRGSVRQNPLFPAPAGQSPGLEGLRFAIERDVRAILGVKDVIFALEPGRDLTPGTNAWQPTTAPNPIPER